MRGAQILVNMLLEYKVEVIFGVPGDTSVPLYEVLHDVRPAIRHVMARDERSASFMADAYARIAHKPGLCECPSGAGPLYSVPGVAEANSSSIPVILLTSDTPLSGEGRKTVTELNCQMLFESITKWSYLIKQGEKIPEIIRRAFRIATVGRPGAVHLVFPEEVMAGDFLVREETVYGEPDCIEYPSYRNRGSQSVMKDLARYLFYSERPVIIVGGGVKRSQANQEVINLAELIAAPVVTTISGRGIMPDDHPLAMGVIGDNGFHPQAHQAVEQGDTLLYVGCKMGSVSTINWTLPSYKPDRKIIQIDVDPQVLSNTFRNALSVAGDAKAVLEDLVHLLKTQIKGRIPSPWLKDLNQAKALFWQKSDMAFQCEETPLKPQWIISTLNRKLPSSSIVIADAGMPTPYVTRFLKLGDHSSDLIIPRSYGGLGYAIPAVVGAHFACPQARLIGLFGDGSFGMSAGELETLARLRIPAVLIHFSNGGFGWIKALQALHGRGKSLSVDFIAGNPALVAEGFGLKAFHIDTVSELEKGLEEAFASDEPVFLDVVTESEMTELPPVYSWLKAVEGRRST